MKNVRLFYKKDGPLRFASHLDMNRFMTRLLRLSSVRVWYTEGFNRHPYITFALPLSLGFSSEYEVMDFRLESDDFPLEQAEKMISDVCPEGLTVLGLKEPVFRPGRIAMADFVVTFHRAQEWKESLQSFLEKEEILVEKKTKKGVLKPLNLSEKMIDYSLAIRDEDLVLTLRLPAGGQDNINPKMVVDAFLQEMGALKIPVTFCRSALRLEDGRLFE